MLKGEIYFICSILSFGGVLFGLGFVGVHWYVALPIALIPSVYFVRKSAEWAENLGKK
jgi:hypothetical protein